MIPPELVRHYVAMLEEHGIPIPAPLRELLIDCVRRCVCGHAVWEHWNADGPLGYFGECRKRCACIALTVEAPKDDSGPTGILRLLARDEPPS